MTLSELLRRIAYLVTRDRASRELEEEMRIHVEMRAESLRRMDVDTALAKATARRRFGNATELQQKSRAVWGFEPVETLMRDFRFALRRLRQRPWFAAAVIGVMAIGIGATTAMFSAVDAALLRPLPFKHPDELVALPSVTIPFDGYSSRPIGRRLEIADVQTMRSTFSDVAAYGYAGINLAERERPIRLNVGMVTTDFFKTLGVFPAVGRAFSDLEGKPNGPDVVILSHAFWQREYGGRNLAGLTITLAEKKYQVIGVMPRNFSFPRESEVWIPMTIPNTYATLYLFHTFNVTEVIARRFPGVSTEAASQQVISKWEQVRDRTVDGDVQKVNERTQKMRTEGAAIDLQRELVGNRISALSVLLGATGLLLLVACVNVSNLLSSQATLRHREIVVRQTLGATRMRIVRQLLTESVLLSVSGAAVGLIVAPIALNVIRLLMPGDLAGIAPATIDFRVLTFATATAVFTGVAFGLWPALGSTRRDASDSIKSGDGHGATSAHSSRTRRALISCELALTVMLLIGAGLMLRSFRELVRRDTGMHIERVGTLELALPRTEDGGDRIRRIDGMLNRLAAMPDIQAGGVVGDLPLSGIGGAVFSVRIDGAPAEPTGDRKNSLARLIQASGGYFAAMGISLLRGRVFTASDDSHAPAVAIINMRMARHYWPKRDPVGQVFRTSLDTGAITVVGVVADIREARAEDDPGMQMYVPVHEGRHTPSAFALVARGSLSDQQLLIRLTQTVRSVDPSQPVFNVRMMNDVISQAFAPRRTNTVLITTFAALGLILATVGVYAVVSSSVSHRTRELGIRSALGATGRDLITIISREIVLVTLAGLAAGVFGAWMLARTLEGLIYGVQIHDTLTFLIVPVVLILPTVIATLVPARRVLRVNPAAVMRGD